MSWCMMGYTKPEIALRSGIQDSMDLVRSKAKSLFI